MDQHSGELDHQQKEPAVVTASVTTLLEKESTPLRRKPLAVKESVCDSLLPPCVQ